MRDYPALAPFEGSLLNVIINVLMETLQGSRNKYNYDPERGFFVVSGSLPLGAVFPFDVGFVPAT